LHCNNCNYCLVKNKNIWRPKNRKVSKYKYWQDSDGTRLKERAEAEFSTSKFEFVQYKKIINASLKLLHKNCVILELGAGDGRFTQLLAAENYVIVNDINFNSLCRLSDLSINNSNLIFICCSFDSLPIKKNSIDMIAAIECLYYSNNEFDYVLSNILKLLKQDGLFLNSEPLIDGAAIYNLIKLDFEQAGINLRNKIKIESMDDSEIKGRLFNKSSLRKILKNNYLEILIEKDIPLIFSIVSYLSSRYKNTIRQSVARNLVGKYNEDYSDSGRCYATLSKKVGDPSK